MPVPSIPTLIKQCCRYEPRDTCSGVPKRTRGIYALYKQTGRNKHEVVYIGVAGIGKKGRSGIRGRLTKHNRRKKGWTHYSLFEVHNNVSREQIRQVEALLLGIFQHDPRIKLLNMQRGSKMLGRLGRAKVWRD